MALYRNRCVQVLAGLAVGLQLLIAYGIAMAAPSADCGSAHVQTMGSHDCTACGTHQQRTTPHSSSLCKVACAMTSVAAPLPPRLITLPTARDAAPTSPVGLHDLSSPDELLRPPADAALLAA